MDLKLNFIAVALFYQLNNGVALHLKFTSNKDIVPCSLNGGNIMWQPLCKLRRDLEIDLADVASRERGPAKDPKVYNPVYGFEPYWEFGDWAFDKIRPKKGEVRMCGSPCPEYIMEVGQICGINKEVEAKTYESYCEMRDLDCEDLEGWTVAYPGPCLGVPLPVPTDPDELASRAQDFINEFNKISPTTTVQTTT